MAGLKTAQGAEVHDWLYPNEQEPHLHYKDTLLFVIGDLKTTALGFTYTVNLRASHDDHLEKHRKYSVPCNVKKYNTKKHILDQSSIIATHNWNDVHRLPFKKKKLR